mmetsp:Transcript_28391/g.28183  ORF Transcript_28391/g.28183 Transcript_28391/m.28183 type:complete len:96 (-) Transcript_28391:139-426(-)
MTFLNLNRCIHIQFIRRRGRLKRNSKKLSINKLVERESLDFSNKKKKKSVAVNTDLSFSDNTNTKPKTNLKEKVLREKLSKMNTGGVGTSTKIGE